MTGCLTGLLVEAFAATEVEVADFAEGAGAAPTEVAAGGTRFSV